jgi:serine/threonine-protein kinase HipA
MTNNPPNRELHVYWDGHVVGLLCETKPGELLFTYSDEWRLNKRSPISISLPLNGDCEPGAAQNFFGNLLPEGGARQRIEKIFRMSAGNDFHCLATLGGDCAGALSVGAVPPPQQNGTYKELSLKELENAVQSNAPESLLLTGNGIRLSLAGAQGKLPVRLFQEKFFLPLDSSPTTHILKFRNTSEILSRLVENEFFVMRVAYHAGLPVAPCTLVSVGKNFLLQVERYDREIKGEQAFRLHQEDFCQALGVSHSQKYESEGGPTFAQCMALARRHLSLREISVLLDWFIFNLCIGNSDSHAKNISILYKEKEPPTLAPFYDLVCTRAYKKVDRKLAMSVGGNFDPDFLTLENFSALSKEIGISMPLLRTRARHMCAIVTPAIEAAKKDFSCYANLNTVQQVYLAMQRSHKRFAKIFT